MNCKVVQDLLPNYVEELCSDETERFIQEHIEYCEECRQVLAAMQAGKAEENTGQDQKVEPKIGNLDGMLTEQQQSKTEKENDIAILRAMKKVVWRRVWIMLFSIIIAVLAVGFLVVLVLAQFHPEWELFNYEQHRMKQTAKEATKAFSEGDIDALLDGIQNGRNQNYLNNQNTSATYEITKKHIQKIYDEYFQGKVCNVECDGSGWIAYNDADEMYTVRMKLSCEEYTLWISYEFFDEDTYLVSCFEDDRESEYAEIGEMFDAWCGYLAQAVYAENDMWEETINSILLAQKKGGIDEKAKKLQSRALILNVFAEDCFDVAGRYGAFWDDASDTREKWIDKLDEFCQSHSIENIWTEGDGVDEKAQKELRTMIWKFTDSQGREGVMMKEFYYGPAGYEPVDGKEKIYGDDLSGKTVEQLEHLFDS